MKKFTNIGSKADIDSSLNESNQIKARVMKLINDMLQISIYGPIDPILQGTIEIIGKEKLASGIINLFSNDDINEKISLLERSRYEGTEYLINSFEKELIDLNESNAYKIKIDDIIRQSNGDDILLEKLCTSLAENTNDIHICNNRAQYLYTVYLDKMAKIFTDRSIELNK